MFTRIRSALFGRKIDIQSEDQVQLKPVLGIHPGIYLSFLYGICILAALFFVLFYPGLKNPGALAVISSEPWGAAVRIDGVTLGAAPCKVFIPRGKHTVEFVLPGFTQDKQEIDVPGRIFASLFMPRRFLLKGNLVSPDPPSALGETAAEYIRWSFTGEPNEAWQIPQVLSEGAYRTGPAARDPAVRETMEAALEVSLRYAVTRASARDLLRAKFLVDSAGISPSPLALIRSLQDISAHIGDTASAAPWLAALVPGGEAAVTGSAWYAASGEPAGKNAVFSNDLPLRLPAAPVLPGIRFIPVPQGFFERPGYPREIMPPLLAAPVPVSQEAWDAFTAENPQWAAGNRDALTAQGLVQEDYLVPVDNPGYPVPAAPGISWYAAGAYCAWLSTKLPPSMDGWEVRLPTEAEWEYAALSVPVSSDSGNGFTGSSGSGLWEWCADLYAPLDFFPVPAAAPAVLEKTGTAPGLERTVKGGSWINPPGSVNQGTRGSLPPDTSSPFVGFRPVIAPKAPGSSR
jgi:formylglycine-generating enzyme required for sulfatase activity